MTDDEIREQVRIATELMIAQVRKALEDACELSLQSGCCGVLQTFHSSTGTYTFQVTPLVPYGEIHCRTIP